VVEAMVEVMMVVFAIMVVLNTEMIIEDLAVEGEVAALVEVEVEVEDEEVMVRSLSTNNIIMQIGKRFDLYHRGDCFITINYY
jgi:hypothetical protein